MEGCIMNRSTCRAIPTALFAMMSLWSLLLSTATSADLPNPIPQSIPQGEVIGLEPIATGMTSPCGIDCGIGLGSSAEVAIESNKLHRLIIANSAVGIARHVERFMMHPSMVEMIKRRKV